MPFLLGGLGFLLLGLVIYAQTFGFGFVFDDHIFIVENPFIKNFHNIHLMWRHFPMTRLVGMYSFALNYRFNQLNPCGYHIFNFAVHLAATGLVWALAELLFKTVRPQGAKDAGRGLSFFVALLFLVHPGQTQAVTYISQRFESMATVFYLAVVYTYLRGRTAVKNNERIMFWGLAGLLMLLGLMTKEVLITAPVMVAAGEWILFPSENGKKPYVILGVAGLLLFLIFSKLLHAGLGVLLQTYPSESHDGDILTPWRYVLTQMRVFLTFLRLLVLPVHQNLDYDYPASTGIFQPPLTLAGLAVIIGFIYALIRLRRNFPLIAFGLAWVLITFSINLVPRSNVIFEHKLYLISFGFFLALVCGLSALLPDKRTVIKIICCMAAVLTVLSVQRNMVWDDELSLWQDVIKNSPNKARVNANLGRVYGSRGQYDQAIYYLSRSIALAPDNISYENRGTILAEQGKTAEALNDLNKAIAMEPGYYTTYIKRSWVYQIRREYGFALADLAHAVRLEPYFPDAYLERGVLLMQMGQWKQALPDLVQVLKLDPFNTQAAQYKAYCLTRISRT